MNDNDRRLRSISSTPHLSPEEVANRAFSSSFRGYSDSEVRSFLRRVSEELAAARERERELVAAVDQLEERLRTPGPLDEQQLLDALGEETARLLRSAREAADDIRNKAEERAVRTVKEAQEEARRTREEAEQLVAQRTRDAEAAAATLVNDAEERAADMRGGVERYAEEQRLRADREADGAIEAARATGREMVDEARGLQERVLADLARRRNLLQGQLDELRAGRDRLLDAYRVVKRTFLEATEALAQVEARAAAERASTAAVTPAELEEVLEGVATGDDATGTPSEAGAATEAAGTVRTLADVDSLFARIREATVHEAGAPPGAEVVLEEQEAAPEGQAGREPGPAAGGPGAGEEPRAGVEAGLARRHSVVEPLLGTLAKRVKRAAQDEQNKLLDSVRRQKARPVSAQVLVSADAQREAWADILRSALDAAYSAGRGIAGAGAGEGRAPDDLTAELTATVIVPLRERVEVAIDDTTDLGGDTHALVVERIGARYREWKSHSVEPLLGDVLATAYTRGVYDGAADGAVLRWVPVEEGRCPDCDDNALEPTVKGREFPTGQPHPPAHPGCRCLLVPLDATEAADAGLGATTA